MLGTWCVCSFSTESFDGARRASRPVAGGIAASPSGRPAARKTRARELGRSYSFRCTRTTVASSGTGWTVNFSFRASASIGALPAITEPSIVV
jgi:hypothetical protein